VRVLMPSFIMRRAGFRRVATRSHGASGSGASHPGPVTAREVASLHHTNLARKDSNER
jgi:hypothetical protein